MFKPVHRTAEIIGTPAEFDTSTSVKFIAEPDTKALVTTLNFQEAASNLIHGVNM